MDVFDRDKYNHQYNIFIFINNNILTDGCIRDENC